MKRIFLIAGIFILSGCNVRQREINLEKKAAELSKKEQELDLRENALEMKEDLLKEKEKSLDSVKGAAGDSTLLEHQQLPGTWQVEMQCIETNCAGSAVGDIKTEQWNFRFQNNMIVITAMRNNNLLRIYTGNYYADNLLRFSVQQDSSSSSKIVVRLKQNSEKDMEGEREITQENGCRIVYALRLKKRL